MRKRSMIKIGRFQFLYYFSLRISIYLFLLFCLFLGNAYGQATTNPLINNNSDYEIETFTLPGGRLGNNVNHIIEGPYGFLWFGSHGGLHRYDGYETITYSSIEGDSTSLTFSYIENLYWDRFDKLWVSTYGEGLYRFDPLTEKFEHFKHNPNDPTTVSHPRVMCVMEDAQNNLWAGTERGLNRFNRETNEFIHYFEDSTKVGSLSSDIIRNLYVDKADNLWIATGVAFWGNPNVGGLNLYHPETDSFTSYLYDPSDDTSLWTNPVRGLLEDSRGDFWVGTTLGLQKMNREKGTFERLEYHPNQAHAPGAKNRMNPAVYGLMEDRNGGIWVGTIGAYGSEEHLLRFDPITQKVEYFPVYSAGWHIYESTDGTVWVAGAGDTGIVLKITKKIKTYDLQQTNVFLDAFKEVIPAQQSSNDFQFIGPLSLGVDTMRNNLWATFVFTFSLKKNLAYLCSYDLTTKTSQIYPLKDLSLPTKYSGGDGNGWGSYGIEIDSTGKIWTSIPHENIGLISFDPTTEKLVHYTHNPNDPNSLSSNYITSVLLDSRGEIWATTYDKGLNRFNPKTNKFTHYGGDKEEPYKIGGLYPNAVVEDDNGLIWVGGADGEKDYVFSRSNFPFLSAINPIANTVSDFHFSGMFRNTTIDFMSFNPYKKKGIFFSLWRNGGGVFNLDEQQFVFFNTTNGDFPFNDIAAIASTKSGIWFSSENDERLVNRQFEENKITVFKNNVKQPFLSRSVANLPDGQILFPNLLGWAAISPTAIATEEKELKSPIQLVDLQVHGILQKPSSNNLLKQPLWLTEQLTLPPTAETFAFRFSDFNFQNNSTPFQYRLFPYEENWRKAENIPFANYFKVPPGNYRFQVKKRTEGTDVEQYDIDFPITINPPWWKTTWAFLLYGLSLIGLIYWIHKFQKERVIQTERAKTQERELAQAKEIEKAYNELKSTQAQLIHAEKMASLGELTAGIAHEIQNPLNFVNNFAEVSKELLEEMEEELDNGDIEEAKAIAKDVIGNLDKIHHHGQRADGIVKGMLQHSRTSSGKRELTDINKLADEYLRLAYHGIRAKDKSFNALMETDFDENLGQIDVIPQDIGRVILNLITNAFYAVNERRQEGTSGYSPKVSVSTKRVDSPLGAGGKGEQIQISVTDNGKGIPAGIVDKIFQPFFTTKPTGQGTGLGLSLSYDIITKGHGGELTVETAEGIGTSFLISLPVD